ncbi:MAG: hypothetical protein GY801_27240, partial [bacterium]|nr:hypothetical protein [bacterium]
MDKTSRSIAANPIVVAGIGWEASSDVWDWLRGHDTDISALELSWDCKPLEYLRERKTLKFMSKQDRLAVAAAGKALKSSGIEEERLQEGCGVFITVGYIPFSRKNADKFIALSQQENSFSMETFAAEGFNRINPLLAFSCLPNMPAHHISLNFDLQGEYVVTYPDSLQFYLTLSEAVERLKEGQVEYALVGGVADQTNFLVQHHYKKVNPEIVTFNADAAAFILLERNDHARDRNSTPLMQLSSLALRYDEKTSSEDTSKPKITFGAADLPVWLSAFLHSPIYRLKHVYQADGFIAEST